MVLLKGFDRQGPVFYTNAESAKGRELQAASRAAALFHWKSLRRQIRIRGPRRTGDGGGIGRLFRQPPARQPDRRLGDQQSRPLESRFALETAVARYAARYAVGDVPRPPLLARLPHQAAAIEFWSDKPFRLHERIDFRRDAPEGDWRKQRLYPLKPERDFWALPHAKASRPIAA